VLFMAAWSVVLDTERLAQDFSLAEASQIAVFEDKLDLSNFSVDFSDVGLPKYATSVVIDGRVVTNYGGEKVGATASTAKMVLALAVMQAKPLTDGTTGEMLTITNDDYTEWRRQVAGNGSNTTVRVGGQISEYDALQSVLIQSSNNMANSLAIWAFGSHLGYDAYASNMLAEWGITDFEFSSHDVSGVDPAIRTSPNSLAIIGQKVLEQETLRNITSKAQADVPMHGRIYNTNSLLSVPEVIGVKTGNLGDYFCYVLGASSNGHNITIALMGAYSYEQIFADARRILTQIEGKLSPILAIAQGQVIGQFDAWWTDDVVPVVATDDIFVSPMDNFKYEITAPDLTDENYDTWSGELRIGTATIRLGLQYL
jgi:D-alanyl-D-alanine carboxypeptidase (penicillin-binding protein 5/6)